MLLVDDSKAIRELVSTALRSAGYRVCEAENGEAGVERASQSSFDLILTDLNMPVLDGLGLTRRVRSMPSHMKTPVLLVTTESQLSKKQEAKAAGANGWVVKPIQPHRLLEVVSRVIG